MNDQISHYQNKLSYEIDSWDLKVSVESGDAPLIIDTRSPAAYLKGHIPGAVNIPHRTMSAESTAALNKSVLVVTYCDGIGCNASTKGALAMSKLGFKVKELMGGLDWWMRDGHPVESGAQTTDAESDDCGCA
ncbi:MAG: rhodanese-like domain-containing protein [Moraxellaceae bacterium]|nr:rhodanese-like domain-containing protein [Moraxellaceae bacterium]